MPDTAAPRRRLRECVESWPECREGDYNPKCCRFPKSCSCDIYDEQHVTEADLEAVPNPATATTDQDRWENPAWLRSTAGTIRATARALRCEADVAIRDAEHTKAEAERREAEAERREQLAVEIEVRT